MIVVRYAVRVVVSFCAALLAATPADAQYFGRNKVHYDRLDFRILQTEHFDVYYYAEEEAATRHVARMAERWYARFSRLLDHTFAQRQPLVLYASHPHFAQTNITSSSPSEGTGGLTERAKSRIAMPFAAGLGATDHVLGHEIAHAFQIDIAKRVKQNAFSLPGWFIEGMAEYLSLGHDNPHTLMWVRDAAQHDRLPTLEQLDDPRYFPYRYGHAFWSYLATRFGDGIVGRVLRARGRGGILARLERATGIDHEQLTADWHESIEAESPTRDLATPVGRVVAAAQRDGARLHIAPSISPDGTRVVFVSERDRLSLDLFVADAVDGANVDKLLSTAADPHFDSLQYIHSAGAWDPSGRRFAIAALSGGTPLLSILDASQPRARQEMPLPTLGEIYTPSWSPDGSRIVFSALKGGLSDLFVYTLATGDLRQLTADPYADLQPTWSPDGRTIALATDRFSSSLDELRFGSLRIGLLDVASGDIRLLMDDDVAAKQVSPQWAPDGSAVFFVSDRRGVSNVYRFESASRELRQVTNVTGGVSGITATSPSLSVAATAGTLAFSVYRNASYEIQTIQALRADEARLVATDLAPPPAPAEPADGTLAQLLDDARTGLAASDTFRTTEYDDRLQLESVIPPFIGAATSSGFGGVLQASFGATFGDMLRDRQLQTLFRVGTDRDDLAMQAAYINRKGQWNWGVIGGFLPSRFVGARRSIEREGALVTRETSHLRYLHQWGGLTARYHLNRAQRLELGGGVRRTGFTWQHITRVIENRETVSRDLAEATAGKPVHLGELRMAFVHDTAVFGATSPVLGQRLRLEIEPVLGGLSFADVRVDARRYFMPVRPVTIAARFEHVGRYGPNAGDARVTPLVLGLQTLVRGYDLRRFAIDECGRTATACSLLDELTGSRFALLNVEVRAPLMGLLTGDLDYGRIPIEAIAFVDAGVLWTRNGRSPLERDQFRSVGAGARANLGGLIVEITGARPFDRTDNGWTVSFLLRPGW